MNTMKKIIAVAMGFTLVAAALAMSGCGDSSSSKNAEATDFTFTSYPMETDVTLTYWTALNTNVAALSEDLNQTPFAEELKAQTGVDVQFIHPPVGQEADQLNILLASENLPDIIENNWYSFSGGPQKALDDGFILDLTDIIPEHSPNLYKYLQANPETDKMIKTDDNRYYVYPFIKGDEKLLVVQGLVVRQDWLDELGLEMPETIDEWHNVLTQFKERKGAEAPLTYQANMLLKGDFIGAFGITRDFTVENGKVIYGPADPRYRDFLETFAQWYQEGLIDSNIANVDSKAQDANILNGKSGVSFGFAGSNLGRWMQALQASDPNAELVAAPHLSRVKGERPKIGQKDVPYSTSGSVAITTSCRNVELAARFLDYGYSEAGHMLYNFGKESKSYNMIDGYPTYTDYILNNENGLSVGAAMGQYIRGNQCGPFVQAREYIEQYYNTPQQMAALEIWADSDMASYSLPKVTFTPEESSEVANIANNINTYVDEMTARYIMGLEDLSTFDTYMGRLKTFRIDRLLELYQGAYERYMKR